MEPELRPEFIKSLKASEPEKTVKVKDFAQRYSKWLLVLLRSRWESRQDIQKAAKERSRAVWIQIQKNKCDAI